MDRPGHRRGVPGLRAGGTARLLASKGLLYRLCLEQGGSAGAVFLVRPQISGRRDLRGYRLVRTLGAGREVFRPQRLPILPIPAENGLHYPHNELEKPAGFEGKYRAVPPIAPGDGSEHGDKRVVLELCGLPIWHLPQSTGRRGADWCRRCGKSGGFCVTMRRVEKCSCCM